jgi:hypothetical protein
MPARNELVIRGNAVGLTASDYPNDSKFEQKILFLEKTGTTYTATKGTQTLTQSGVGVTTQTVTIGNRTYTYRTALTGVKATALLTSNATAPANGDTVQIGNITYTFKTALTVSSATNGFAIFPYEVLIGASAAIALDNIKIAINNSGGTAGTEYSIGTTAHPVVTATTNTNTTQLIEAKAFGTAANTYPVSEQGANLAWGAATMGTVVTSEVAGVNTIADEIKLTGVAATELDILKEAINGTDTITVTSANATIGAVYQSTSSPTSLVTVNATIAAQTTLVTTNTSSNPLPASGTLTKVSGTGDTTITYSAITAIQGTDYSLGTTAHTEVTATTNTATTQIVEARNAAFDNASIATTETGTNMAWGAATLASGVRGITARGTIGTNSGVIAASDLGVSGDKNVV